MLVYNVTSNISAGLATEWIAWQLQEQIPAIMRSGCFDRYSMYRLLDEADDSGTTFVIQYVTTTMERYQDYEQQHAGSAMQRARAKWGNDHIVFTTIMQAVR